MNIHGEYTALLNGNIIESKLVGSFNEDGFSAYANAIKEHVVTLNGNAFAMLIDNSELEGGTPEAYIVFEEYSKWMSNQAVIAKAYLISSLVQKDIMLQRTPELKKQNVEFFTERQTAIDWLAKQLL